LEESRGRLQQALDEALPVDQIVVREPNDVQESHHRAGICQGRLRRWEQPGNILQGICTQHQLSTSSVIVN